jgi:hypothetical protein
VGRLALLALILLLLGVNAYVYGAIFAPAVIRVEPLALSKGHATLVLLPAGHTILINTGPDASIVRALGGALPPWQRHIDALFLSSNKADAGGESFIRERYSVESAQKIPPAAGLVLHAGALALPLSSTTPGGVYQIK